MIRTCTLGPWNYSGLHDNTGYYVQPFRIREGRLFKDGKMRIQCGDIYELKIEGNYDERYTESTRLGLERGYTQRYGRNTCEFVMSRAARKRGVQTTDGAYLRRAAKGRLEPYTG